MSWAICFWVSVYLASDSERACSKVDTCSALMADAGSFSGSQGLGRSEGEFLAGKNTECAASDKDCETLWWTLRLHRIGPLGDPFLM